MNWMIMINRSPAIKNVCTKIEAQMQTMPTSYSFQPSIMHGYYILDNMERRTQSTAQSKVTLA